MDLKLKRKKCKYYSNRSIEWPKARSRKIHPKVHSGLSKDHNQTYLKNRSCRHSFMVEHMFIMHEAPEPGQPRGESSGTCWLQSFLQSYDSQKYGAGTEKSMKTNRGEYKASCKWSRLIFNMDTTTFRAEKMVFSVHGTEKTGYPHAKKQQLEPDLTKGRKFK